jgi:hypothetical protein
MSPRTDTAACVQAPYLQRVPLAASRREISGAKTAPRNFGHFMKSASKVEESKKIVDTWIGDGVNNDPLSSPRPSRLGVSAPDSVMSGASARRHDGHFMIRAVCRSAAPS